MAIKITASVTVRKRDLRAEALDPDAPAFVASRVRDVLREALRQVVSAAFTDGITVTVQEVNKKGEPKGALTSTASAPDAWPDDEDTPAAYVG